LGTVHAVNWNFKLVGGLGIAVSLTRHGLHRLLLSTINIKYIFGKMVIAVPDFRASSLTLAHEPDHGSGPSPIAVAEVCDSLVNNPITRRYRYSGIILESEIVPYQ